jgi:hypothetical protein
MESMSFWGRFFQTIVTEMRYKGFLTNWDIPGTFLLVKNHQFGIICNFRKSLKMGKIILKYKECKDFRLDNNFMYNKKFKQ